MDDEKPNVEEKTATVRTQNGEKTYVLPQRDAKGRLMPGYSGNPVGRPRNSRQAARVFAGENGETIYKFLYDVMVGNITAKPSQLEAAKELLVRAQGKPVDVQLQGELDVDAAEALSGVEGDDVVELLKALKPTG